VEDIHGKKSLSGRKGKDRNGWLERPGAMVNDWGGKLPFLRLHNNYFIGILILGLQTVTVF
jgi:hypothetical protein